MAKLTGNAWNAHEDETKDFHSGEGCNKWIDYASNEMGCAGMSISLWLRGDQWQINMEADGDRVLGKIFNYNHATGTNDYGPIECSAETDAELLEMMLQQAAELEKDDALSIAAWARWFNDKRQQHYIVVGIVRSCEAADWELLYRHEHGVGAQYFRRPAHEWLGVNSNGNPRFVKA